MRNFISFLILTIPILTFAGPGDTTEVLAMDHMDMTWYGAYKDTTELPDTAISFRKIYMEVTVGCATGGCSDWDYTVKIEAKRLTGNDNSKYELGRFITPYGGSLSNNWEHKLVYDVTDFEQLLRDSVEITAFYSGWSSGFSATVNFLMIEGTPSREVIKFENLYRGSWNSDNPDTFELYATPAKQISILANTSQARVKITPSGHGFINSQNCAEFCERDYYVKTDGVVRDTQAIWRNDCGLNPVYPQAGTWLYDRANWCPGAKAFAYNHELTPYITPGQNLDIDIDFEIYALTVPAGETPPNYILDAQIFQYGSSNFNIDAEIKDIITPSLKDIHSRKNPICGSPLIEIENGGSTTLTTLTITYGVTGTNLKTFNWTGNLKFLETEIVELDLLDDWDGATNTFEVTLSNPNGATDENSYNNFMKSNFEAVPVYPNNFVIESVTNNQPDENELRLFDDLGNEILYNGMYGVFTASYDTVNLEEGCYEFLVSDTDKDGLTFFANNDGNGSIAFRSTSSLQVIHKSFPANFGTEIRHQFRVDETSSLEKSSDNFQLEIYPNPNNGSFNMNFIPKNENTLCRIFNVLGELVYSGKLLLNKQPILSLRELESGTYFVFVDDKENSFNQKIIIVK